MKKYNLYLKTTLFIFISVILVACPHNPDECTWKVKTTQMYVKEYKGSYNMPIYHCEQLQEYDSCYYDSLRIHLFFETELLPNQDVCDNPHDSVMGLIKKLVIISMNDYNNQYQSHDTLNPIIDITYMDNSSITEMPISLNSFINNKPLCTPKINLFFNIPPYTKSLQQFIIEYEEDNGTHYQDTTIPIYIKP